MKHEGWHNEQLEESIGRLRKGNTYKNLSTIWIVPTRGKIADRIINSWMNMMKPMNQAVVGPIFIRGDEVGVAYNKGIRMILDNPALRDFKYVLTVEEDNAPPPDGLLRLFESINKYDVVGGLYWTKGPEGQPMIYGDPNTMPRNMVPQLPQQDTVQPCNGLGMGFNLFKLDIFKKMPEPWFSTVQDTQRGQWTQDLWFYNNLAKIGGKVACDTRVKVGHYDYDADFMW